MTHPQAGGSIPNKMTDAAGLDRKTRAMAEELRDDEIRVYGNNGWKMWEAMPADIHPKCRWQDSWSDEGAKDIIGFDGTKPIGRVFQIESVINPDLWFWILYGVEEAKQKRPKHGSGWERSMFRAACRVEWCYAQMRLNLSR